MIRSRLLVGSGSTAVTCCRRDPVNKGFDGFRTVAPGAGSRARSDRPGPGRGWRQSGRERSVARSPDLWPVGRLSGHPFERAEGGTRSGTRQARPPRRNTSEAHLPAQRPQAGEEPRLSPSHVDASRPIDHQEPPIEGPGQAVGLILPIRSRRTFEALRAHGVRVRRGPMAVVYLRPDEPDAQSSVGYAITKRVGSAVVRNRVRRRLRAVLAEIDASRPDGLPGGAMLISAGPDVVRYRPEELRNHVERLVDALESRIGAQESR